MSLLRAVGFIVWRAIRRSWRDRCTPAEAFRRDYRDARGPLPRR